MNAAPKHDYAGLQPGEIGKQDSNQLVELSGTSATSVKDYPAHGTQPARLLAALLHGLNIEPLTAWKKLGIYRLADTVFQLRAIGWLVITERLDVTNRFREACRVAQYCLPEDAIGKAGNAGQDFAKHEFELLAAKKAA